MLASTTLALMLLQALCDVATADDCTIPAPVPLIPLNETFLLNSRGGNARKVKVKDTEAVQKRALAAAGSMEGDGYLGAPAEAALVIVNPRTCQQTAWPLPGTSWTYNVKKDTATYVDKGAANGPVTGLKLRRGKGGDLGFSARAKGAGMDYALRGLDPQGSLVVGLFRSSPGLYQITCIGMDAKKENPAKGTFLGTIDHPELCGMVDVTGLLGSPARDAGDDRQARVLLKKATKRVDRTWRKIDRRRRHSSEYLVQYWVLDDLWIDLWGLWASLQPQG